MDNIFTNWERVLRWAYPGGLFSVLLLLSPKTMCLPSLLLWSELHFSLKLLAIFSIGVFIYLIQNLIIRWILECILVHTLCKFKWYENFIKHRAIKLHYGFSKYETGRSHRDEYMARYHALSISGWLTIIFIFFNHCYVWIGMPILILLFSWYHLTVSQKYESLF